MCGLSLDHRICTRIDVDESFKCRTVQNSKIWTCEEIYFNGVEH